MQKCIAIGCVLGWSFFAIFGYLAVSGLQTGSDYALLAAEMALYGMAIGSMTWSYIRSMIVVKRKPAVSDSVIEG